MSKKRPYFQIISKENDLQSSNNIVKRLPKREKSLRENENIQLMPDALHASIRAGQIIGSSARAIEELLHNSIIHGKATFIHVTVGKRWISNDGLGEFGGRTLPFIEVQDNGKGIDPESVRLLIGTKHCSSDVALSVEDNYSFANYHYENFSKGQSLKALAAVCVEMKIKTTSSTILENHSNILCHDSRGRNNPVTVTCEKTIRHGDTVEFHTSRPLETSQGKTLIQSSLLKSDTASECTGTIVTLNGLFHNHIVRRRHYETKSNENPRTDISNNPELNQVRNVMQMLSFAFPTVRFRLVSAYSAHHVVIWETKDETNMKSSILTLNSFTPFPVLKSIETLKSRLLNICGIGSSIYDVWYKENGSGKTINMIQPYHVKKASPWILYGAIAIIGKHTKGPQNQQQRVGNCRMRQYELIFINGRMSKSNSFLSDVIHDELIRFHKTLDDFFAYFIFHICCPPEDVELVFEETRSMILVFNKDRLIQLVKDALKSAMKKFHTDSSFTFETPHKNTLNQPASVKQVQCATNTNGKGTISTSSICSRRLISSHRFFKKSESTEETILNNKTWCEKSEMNSKIGDREFVSSNSSPFSSAFINNRISISLDKESYSTEKDGFQCSPLSTNIDIVKQRNDSSDLINNHRTWTRKRLKRLDTQIINLYNSDCISRALNSNPVTLTKDMLSRAQFVAQLDAKFILIICDGILCAVDQHAADERIGLEKLEKILHLNIEGINSENDSIDLSKLPGILSKDILKSVQLHETQSMVLSPHQLACAKKNRNVLNRWKFGFDILNEKEGLILLRSVPGICNRVVSSKEFIHLVQLLSNSTINATSEKPEFVKRVLSSYACRYAIMFGDVLMEKKCLDIIDSLSKCEMSFICAHGRPSVVPLMDMTTVLLEEDIKKLSTVVTNDKEVTISSVNSASHQKKNNLFIPLRFQQRYRKG